MASNSVRLNYTISQDVDDQLSGYCEITGRSASDVVRQLVSEVIEDDRPLPSPAVIRAFAKTGAPRTRRTDMWMSSISLNTLDERLDDGGYPSKSAVIAFLLKEFLAARSSSIDSEMIRITAFVSRSVFSKLTQEATDRDMSVDELISDLSETFANQSEARVVSHGE